MYSQEGEEKVILDYFGPFNGRFLDLGAYDGKAFSNTLALYDKGWSGVLVEASPQCFKSLQRIYKDRKRSSLVCACVVAGGPRMVKFYDDGGANATVSTSHKQKWLDVPYTEIYVPGIGVRQLLQAFPGKFDFISIDLEGISWEVLVELGPHLLNLKTRLLCVEVESEQGRAESFMKSLGYDLLGKFPVGANMIFKWRK